MAAFTEVLGKKALSDLNALFNALKKQEIGQACLDVMPIEPWPQDNPLWELPNLFITPHLAWSSPFFRQRTSNMWLDNLKRYVMQVPLQHVIHQVE